MTGRYPSEPELKAVRDWEIPKDITGLLKFLEEIWEYAGIGYFKLTGVRVLKLELHTGGWSGNEEIINALKQCKYFFGFYWRKSVVGGHYYFEIRLPKKK